MKQGMNFIGNKQYFYTLHFFRLLGVQESQNFLDHQCLKRIN